MQGAGTNIFENEEKEIFRLTRNDLLPVNGEPLQFTFDYRDRVNAEQSVIGISFRTFRGGTNLAFRNPDTGAEIAGGRSTSMAITNILGGIWQTANTVFSVTMDSETDRVTLEFDGRANPGRQPHVSLEKPETTAVFVPNSAFETLAIYVTLGVPFVQSLNQEREIWIRDARVHRPDYLAALDMSDASDYRTGVNEISTRNVLTSKNSQTSAQISLASGQGIGGSNALRYQSNQNSGAVRPAIRLGTTRVYNDHWHPHMELGNRYEANFNFRNANGRGATARLEMHITIDDAWSHAGDWQAIRLGEGADWLDCVRVSDTEWTNVSFTMDYYRVGNRFFLDFEFRYVDWLGEERGEERIVRIQRSGGSEFGFLDISFPVHDQFQYHNISETPAINLLVSDVTIQRSMPRRVQQTTFLVTDATDYTIPGVEVVFLSGVFEGRTIEGENLVIWISYDEDLIYYYWDWYVTLYFSIGGVEIGWWDDYIIEEIGDSTIIISIPNWRINGDFVVAFTREYEIVLNLNGGTMSGISRWWYYTSLNPTFDLPEPTRIGFTFDGWFDNPGYRYGCNRNTARFCRE
jgi:hypothetical protein